MRERREERLPAGLKIIYDDGEEYVAGFVDDASATGLMLEAPNPLPIGAEICLQPTGLLEEPWFGLRGRVKRCYLVDPDAAIDRWGTGTLYAIAVQLFDVTAEQELELRRKLPSIATTYPSRNASRSQSFDTDWRSS